MNYHSFLEGAGPDEFGPNTHGGSQPGFATAAINSTAVYISPVAQMLSVLAALLGARVDSAARAPASSLLREA